MCLCGNLGILKESGQYSTLAPNTIMNVCIEISIVPSEKNEIFFGLVGNVNFTCQVVRPTRHQIRP